MSTRGTVPHMEPTDYPHEWNDWIFDIDERVQFSRFKRPYETKLERPEFWEAQVKLRWHDRPVKEPLPLWEAGDLCKVPGFGAMRAANAPAKIDKHWVAYFIATESDVKEYQIARTVWEIVKPNRVCQVCGLGINSRRADAKTCSASCKKARQRKSTSTPPAGLTTDQLLQLASASSPVPTS